MKTTTGQRFVVRGADAQTGEDRWLKIEASSQDAAEAAARGQGMLVSSVALDAAGTLDYADAKLDGRAKQPAPRKGGAGDVRRSIFEWSAITLALTAGAILLAVGWGEAGFSNRFATDNAVGATANAVEQLAGLGKIAVAILLFTFATAVRIYGVVRTLPRR